MSRSCSIPARNFLDERWLVVDSHHSLRLFRPTLEALSATQPAVLSEKSQERESNPRALGYESKGEARFHPAQFAHLSSPTEEIGPGREHCICSPLHTPAQSRPAGLKSRPDIRFEGGGRNRTCNLSFTRRMLSCLLSYTTIVKFGCRRFGCGARTRTER